MLENTRFHKSEEKNDLDLARQMAALGDVYVNEYGSQRGVLPAGSMRGRANSRTRIPPLQSQPPVNPARRSPATTAGQPRMMSQMRPDR